MITAIGLMVGFYILARYVEMFHNATTGEKIMLVIFTIFTVLCIITIIGKDIQMS